MSEEQNFWFADVDAEQSGLPRGVATVSRRIRWTVGEVTMMMCGVVMITSALGLMVVALAQMASR